MNWKDLVVDPEGTHHLLNGIAIYDSRFDEVLKYHAPGLAPVCKSGQGWHIRPDGSEAYSHRFVRTFGFYENLAAVDTGSGWFHVGPDGLQIYDALFEWCGNFQEGRCPVRLPGGRYGHIDFTGQLTTSPVWKYAGDFRDGIAVVQRDDGCCSHVTKDGDLLHGVWFKDLDVFHKGFARACDERGWAHVTTNGSPIYERRFAIVEPFYNGQARVERFDGAREIVNERGECIVLLRPALRSEFSELSADLVGYWKTETIASAVEVGLFNTLPGSLHEISTKLNLHSERLHRLLMGLGELGLVKYDSDQWSVTSKGIFLCSSHPTSLAEAAKEYATDLREPWRKLATALRCNSEWQPPDIFQNVAADDARLIPHHRMLNSYAEQDYALIPARLALRGDEHVVDAGGGMGSLALALLKHYPSLHVTLLDLPNVITAARSQASVESGLHYCPGDLFQKWPLVADVIIMARVLHDWDDAEAVRILTNARQALHKGGRIFVIEMIRPDVGFSGSLCDLHLLAVTGGRERTKAEFSNILERAGFVLDEVRTIAALPSIIVGGQQ